MVVAATGYLLVNTPRGVVSENTIAVLVLPAITLPSLMALLSSFMGRGHLYTILRN